MDIKFTEFQKEVREIKRQKKLTLDQKKLLSACGLNPAEWMNLFEDKKYLHVVHKVSGDIKIIDKQVVEVVETRVGNKRKMPRDFGRIIRAKKNNSHVHCSTEMEK